MNVNINNNADKSKMEVLSISSFSSSESGSESSELSDFSDFSSESDKLNKSTKLDDSESAISVNEFISKDFVKLCKDYDYIPTIHPKTRRIIVLGDIHGDMKLAIKMLKIGKVISIDSDENIEWIGEDTIVVQVGDQIDRCRPHSINSLSCNIFGSTIDDEASDIKILKLFTELHYKAKIKGGKVISLLGNHELMNSLGSLEYVSKMNFDEFNDYIDSNNPSLKFQSGEEARRHAFKPGNDMAILMGCTRVSCVVIGSNLFVHAGMIDTILDELKVKKRDDLEKIDIKVRKWLLGLINKEYVKHIINSNNESMFWNRILGNIPHNISNDNPECIKHIKNVVKILQIGHIIVGHTPQSFLHGHGINGICDNKIWRVDNASSSAFHGYDKKYLTTGKIDINRTPQVLEILDDDQFNILK